MKRACACLQLLCAHLCRDPYEILNFSSQDKTEVESVQLGYNYIADMDKCPQDKCCLDKGHADICNMLYMFPGPFA